MWKWAVLPTLWRTCSFCLQSQGEWFDGTVKLLFPNCKMVVTYGEGPLLEWESELWAWRQHSSPKCWQHGHNPKTRSISGMKCKCYFLLISGILYFLTNVHYSVFVLFINFVTLWSLKFKQTLSLSTCCFTHYRRQIMVVVVVVGGEFHKLEMLVGIVGKVPSLFLVYTAYPSSTFVTFTTKRPTLTQWYKLVRWNCDSWFLTSQI
jgi:hypothetical protein